MSTRIEELEAKVKDRGKRGLIYHIKKEPLLYVMILPALVYLIIFKYIPMYGITVAFQKYNIAKGYFQSPWVGFKYFELFFRDPYLFRIVRNTFLLSLYSLVFGFPAPILLAILLNEVRSMTYKRIIQTVSYLPHFISVVVIVGLLKIFFATDGFVNSILGSIGVEAQRWFVHPMWFRPLYIASGVWQGVGWGAILYLAALTGINEELYEAAYVDGANRFKRMLNITLPGIRGTIILLLIFRIGSLMSVGFEKVFLMYSPTTYEVADVISTYVYRRGIEAMQFSYATAVGLFNSVINFTLLFVANFLAKRYSEYSLW